MSELRWNPLLAEWVVTATHRQERTYHPPADFCPLCPTRPGAYPTEVPAENYEIVVFENKFPSFRRTPPEPSVEGDEIYRVRASRGICEVVLYSPNHNGSLATSEVVDIARLIDVWTDRYEELGRLDYIDYVLIFENKGEVIGVTLEHPHGQIYAFPFIPPRPARELESAARHWHSTGRCLFCDILEREIADGRRIVAQSDGFVAVVPFFARYPYEVHILPRRHAASLLDFADDERWGLAEILKVVLQKYDNLFGFSLPYIMAMHQAPTDGREYPHYHYHIEFYPPNRTATKLKYLAGCESGAGTFINDTLPEETAATLRTTPPCEPGGARGGGDTVARVGTRAEPGAGAPAGAGAGAEAEAENSSKDRRKEGSGARWPL
ncbi:MAG: galactose-1-phosphate uridylyltransferase [Bacillota bacterium]|nr:galactose-1-phosphate uridylyltransferase [Bacillota bacterium]